MSLPGCLYKKTPPPYYPPKSQLLVTKLHKICSEAGGLENLSKILQPSLAKDCTLVQKFCQSEVALKSHCHHLFAPNFAFCQKKKKKKKNLLQI